METKLELMAPAGSWEALQAALDNGADSIYFGVDQLNMRARATMNFTLEDLPEIASRCKRKGVKTYLTLNTIVYDHDLSIIKTVINKVKESQISAIIASDQAVISYANTIGVEVHISTQLNITNIETVKFYAHFSNVMVLSRELSLGQIKRICSEVEKEKIKGSSGDLVKIEVFGHGALCMAVSGKCYLSLHTQNASANRGACMQNCRRKYKVIDMEDGHELALDNEYIMSPKDLCTIDFLDELIETGISVLKIEGRGRAPEYVATVTRCYREAIDAYYEGNYTEKKINEWMNALDKIYNRGFWGGYYLGQELGEWTDTSGSKATQKKVYLGKGIHYFPKAKVGHFKIESQALTVGDKVLITGPTTGVIETEIASLQVDGQFVKSAGKEDECTFTLDQTIRKADKLYKLVAT
ncbi:peptidase U32 family protein [Fulvivirgaceae bacterium BMA10]|uniref:Peptidase U32 family protein n=1 Tax=Splendidivirga corallicola TaxID=3051826 RepID=A0ABT8KUD3_9BACT|nr:peptidase U32 family protein [Fulvivirgaceae bacterium BMA10]